MDQFDVQLLIGFIQVYLNPNSVFLAAATQVMSNFLSEMNAE
jgi:hypothetical protein